MLQPGGHAQAHRAGRGGAYPAPGLSWEPIDTLIDDPWLVLPCKDAGAGCELSFSDPDFVAGGRESVYYVRALQAPSPTVNAANLRCEYDAAGSCLQVKPCSIQAGTDLGDDCLADASERAWSSPIFVAPSVRQDAGGQGSTPAASRQALLLP